MVCPLIWGPRELRPSLVREIMFKTLSITQHGDTYGNGFQVQTLQTQSLNENKKLCLGLLINKEEERTLLLAVQTATMIQQRDNEHVKMAM